MGKLLCDSPTIAEKFQPSVLDLSWRDPISPSFDQSLNNTNNSDLEEEDIKTSWETVSGLEDQQKKYLKRLYLKGVLWKSPINDSSLTSKSIIFRLSHGGDVEADGNCLFTATKKAMCIDIDAIELRQRTVRRFTEDFESDVGGLERESINTTIKHLYSPDLKTGWGIHIVQEVKMLAKKEDREDLDIAIKELVDLGLPREVAAESIYKERCIAVEDGQSWAKYMSISGSSKDEFDIITLQYTEEGLLSIDENREGHAAAFGDDIAIESLATEFYREIYVVQAHGSDGMVDEDNCVFFLPHRPRSQICRPPFFLFMKGTGWCGAGADHYEPLIAHSTPHITQEKAAVIL